jgi:peptidoglycan hydrolase-like protein with peptidoglycan-binding domain
MYLTDLTDVLRAVELAVVEVAGWQIRGRRDGEQMDGVKSIICHHTAGPATGDTPSLDVVIHGRPGLGGPLSQLYLSRAGVWHVVAAGKANHAGQVDRIEHSNAWAIGVEAEATGVDAWPPAQFVSYVTGVAALALHYKLSVGAVLGHKEVAVPVGRKVDPNFNMTTFRALVDREMRERVGRDHPRPPAPVVLERYLKQRFIMMHGNDVRAVQRAVDCRPDGWYGPDTKACVRSFQRRRHLVDDGIVGPVTARALGLVWKGPSR